MHRRRILNRRAAWALLLGFAVFAAGELAVNLVMDYRRPELRDPEYGYKLIRLRAFLAAHPNDPLMLIFGSSRSQMGLQPEALASCSLADGRKPAVFNYAMPGLGANGVMKDLLFVHRLRALGVRPRWLLVELLPGTMPWLGLPSETVQLERMTWSDTRYLSAHSNTPLAYYSRWLRARIVPAYSRRFSIMTRYAPESVPWLLRQDHYWHAQDLTGWMPYSKDHLTAEEWKHGVEHAHGEWAPGLAKLDVSPFTHGLLDELIQYCRSEGIEIAFYIMPEGEIFRSWYPPDGEAKLNRYLAELQTRYRVPVFDARTWMHEPNFADSHHLFRQSAMAFSQRFAREALQPFLDTKYASVGRPDTATTSSR